MVLPNGKQSTGTNEMYEFPAPSGKKVVPLTGGAQTLVNGTGETTPVIVVDCAKQISRILVHLGS